MIRANQLETILNNLNGTAIYVIRRDNREILYFNERVREIVPTIRQGSVCRDIWQHNCEKCPLDSIGPTEPKTVTRFNKNFNAIVDLTAIPIRWEKENAFIISVAPHRQSDMELKLELERKKLGTIAAQLYPRAISVNLTQNTYSVLHDDLSIPAHPDPLGEYSDLFSRALGCIHPDFREEFARRFSRESLLKRHENGEKEIHMEHRQSTGGEEYEWTETHVIMMDNPVNDDVIEITLVRSIEENKRREVLLEQENRGKTELLHQALKNTSMYEFYYYPQEKTVIIPRRLAERWETREQYTDVPFDLAEELIHEKDREYYCQIYKKVEDGAKNASGSYRIKQGGWREMILSTISTDDKGKPTFVVGISRDITENKMAELENIKLQSIYDFTITRNYDCLLIWNVETDTYEARFSGPLEKAGMPLSGTNRQGIQIFSQLFVCEEDRPLFLDEIYSDAFFEKLENQAEDIHIWFRCPQNGQLRHKELSLCYINNNRMRILMTMRDIDDMVRKEEQGRVALEKAFEAARSANEAKGDFLSRMSHDMRTPMNAIIGMTAIGRAHHDDPVRVLDCMDKIDISSQHLLNLINEVLDMSRIDSGKLVLADEPFNLSELIRNMLAIVRPDLNRKGHMLKIGIGNVRNEQVIGDRQRLSEVFVNIMSNAVKYTPENGKIVFTMHEKDSAIPGIGCYQFIFEDNGIGISADFQKKMFDPFERAEDTRINHIHGTGLGMSIALNIVKMMDGSIDVESKIGKGSRFTVTLYLKRQTSEPEHHPDLARLSVLVAGDGKENGENLCRLVQELGMKSDRAFSGSETIEKIRQADKTGKPYDAILLDWTMPDMNGIEIARAIHDKTLENTPAVIISTDDWTEIESEAKKAGVDAFVPRPLFRSYLANVIHTVLGTGNDDPQTSRKTEPAMPRFDGKKILLVEDNELNAEIAAELISMTGASVDTVSNGKAAIEKFSTSFENHYDLIFMDIQMPVMNGRDATVAIRKLDRNDAKTIPVISMSANTFPEDIRLAKASGMNDHIPKPLNIGHLADIMKKWMANNTIPAPTI